MYIHGPWHNIKEVQKQVTNGLMGQRKSRAGEKQNIRSGACEWNHHSNPYDPTLGRLAMSPLPWSDRVHRLGCDDRHIRADSWPRLR
jgi:hypothetical protein